MDRLFCDPRRCVGCHACEVACAVEHSPTKTLFEAVLADDPPWPRRAVEMVGTTPYMAGVEGMLVSLGCHHCTPAPCVDACISGAMHKEGEVTVCNQSQCVGCWMCVMSCPYQAITPRQKALKCDLCPDRVDHTGRSRYACIEACPTEALFAGTFDAFRKILAEPVTPMGGQVESTADIAGV